MKMHLPSAAFRWLLIARNSGFVRDAAVLQAGDGVRIALAFAAGVVLARMLGSVDYGRYALIASLASLLPLIFDVGVKRTLLVGLSEARGRGDEARIAELAAFGIAASLLTAAVILCVGWLLLPAVARLVYSDARLGVTAWWLTWANLALVPHELLVASFESGREMRRVAALEIAAEALRLAALSVAWAAGAGLGGAVAASLGACAVQGFLALWIFASLDRRKSPHILPMRDLRTLLSPDRVVGNLRFGLGASVAKRLDRAVRTVLVLLLGAAAPASEVGFFRVGGTLATLPLWLTTALARSAFPKLAEIKARHTDRAYSKSFTRLALGSGALVAPAAAAIALAAPIVIARVYGAEFLPAVEVAWILIAASVLIAFDAGAEALYLLEGSLRLFNLRNVAGALVSLLSAPLLIGSLQARGAALALALGIATTCVIDFTVARRPFRSRSAPADPRR